MDSGNNRSTTKETNNGRKKSPISQSQEKPCYGKTQEACHTHQM
jgi:hypothetical protein